MREFALILLGIAVQAFTTAFLMGFGIITVTPMQQVVTGCLVLLAYGFMAIRHEGSE